MSKKDAKKGKETTEPPKPIDPTVDLRSITSVTKILSEVKHFRQSFQLERDKVHKFWEITQKELENARYELLNYDEELEEMENKHQVEMKVYKQKVRHLMYEHRLQVQEIRSQSDREIKQATDSHHKHMEDLFGNKGQLHDDIEKQVADHEESVLKERDSHLDMRSNIKRQNYQKALTEQQEEYERKLSNLRNELELRRRAEIHEIEERKHEHINELIRLHKQKFAEMKSYYNQITGNNLDLIRSLKEEIASMKRNEEHNDTLMYDIEKENHHLSEPLEVAKREVAELQLQLHSYEKDKLSLRHTRSRLRSLDGEYHDLHEDDEALKRKFQDVYNDRDSLKSKFEVALHNAMDVTDVKNVELQQRLTELHSKVEERDAQLSNVLAAVNLQPGALDAVTRKLEDQLETKNRAIKDLHFELKKVERQHRDVVAEYERRCHDQKVPPLDLTKIL